MPDPAAQILAAVLQGRDLEGSRGFQCGRELVSKAGAVTKRPAVAAIEE